MKNREVKIGEPAYHALLGACCDASDLDKALEVLDLMRKDRVVPTVVRVLPSGAGVTVALNVSCSARPCSITVVCSCRWLLPQELFNTALSACVRLDKPAAAHVSTLLFVL